MEQGRQYTGGGATALPSVATVLALLSTSGPADLVGTTVFSTHTKSRFILNADLLFSTLNYFSLQRPLIAPTITRQSPSELNFLKEVNGQFQVDSYNK